KQISRGSLSKDLPQWRFDGKMLACLTGGVIKVVLPNGDDMRQIYPPPHRSTSADSDNSQPADDETSSMKLPPIEFFRWAPKGLPIVARQITDSAVTTVGQAQWWDKGQRPAAAQDGPAVLEAESLVLIPNLDVDKPLFLRNSAANQVGLSWYP